MKTKTIILLTAIVSIICLSSCSNKFSLTKRHYTKGYHFSHSKSNTKAIANKVDKKTQNISSAITTVSPTMAVTQDVSGRNSRLLAKAEPNKALEQKIGFTTPTESTKLSAKDVFQTASTFKVKHLLNNAELNSISEYRDRSQGLSLFWIIILVLLILWIFGYSAGSFGLGGVFNLLLLIALILLILWLLRII